MVQSKKNANLMFRHLNWTAPRRKVGCRAKQNDDLSGESLAGWGQVAFDVGVDTAIGH